MSGGQDLFNELWRFHEQQLAPEKVSSFDFAELVTCLLFLKIDDERAHRRFNNLQVVPEGLGWQSLINKDGSALEGSSGMSSRNVASSIQTRSP